MAQRSHVPKFGNWESEENVPYTAYFDKARKGRSGSPMTNPNDPQEYANAISGDKSPARAPVLKTGAEPEAAVIPGVRPNHERRSSREDGDLRRSSDSPARYDNVVRKTGDSRTGRKSGGSSIEQSPIHPQQARVSGKGTGVSSPSWERKGSSEHNHGLAPSTPVRSRLRTATRGDETLDKGAAVPKFGEWDEKDPASADGYTHIFNIVREERLGGGGSGKVPVVPSSSNGYRQDNNNDSTAACCFGWCRK
ncbi:RPM1-interacting protein 4-like [Macadamia integrifolia]|uniref:RPM1-interacting protein 4-like n=1 Tax=Macadamia integrifolia TaxID=60698 RepID=UPI001C4F1200|nr:RPM1-interacting protein 4-like [Macadamia integrifolia]XP_042500091.1 RPM1-interacting protein 4-like [Macadamia integrifolia]